MQTNLARSVVKLLILVALSAFSTQAVPLKDKANEKDDSILYRLPNNTRPITYDVHLTTRVDKGDFAFTGEVLIVLQVPEPTSEITIHARQLQINSVNLTSAYLSPQLFESSYAYDNTTEFLKVTTKEPLPRDYYRLYIEYSGKLRDDKAGFYYATYTDDNGKDVYLAATQFETTHARHAFPCYDEPSKKAIFRISITHGQTYTAISNMPVIEGPVDNHDGTATTIFRQTTLMSPYLLAFIVSDFKTTEMTRRIPHRIFSRNGTQSSQMFALLTSVQTLEALEDYLEVPYELPKMDNAAVPDFRAGAMENWGLVIYREESLLYTPGWSTTQTQKKVASTIAHEFGHQWFGNLATPLWWTYTWLSEGFATLLAYIGIDAVYPEWEVWQDFQVSDFQRALLADGKKDARPMTHYVEAPSAIPAVFDYVSYSKAASVLMMIRHAFTESTFKKALNNYLIKMKYLGAEEDDLFESFDNATKEDKTFGSNTIDVYKILKSWSNQGGYPLITVTRDYSKGTFEVKQEPFDGTSAAPSTDQRTWWVPFNFATAKYSNSQATTMYDYLNVGESKKTVNQTDEYKWDKSDWILLNKHSTGYYRVNYDNQNWNLLTEALLENPSQFHVNNRAQLLDDAFRLALAKRLKFGVALGLSTYLQKESEYAPWVTANSILSTINLYLNGASGYEVFQFYVGKIVENFYKEVGVTEKNSDSHLRKLSRSIAINWACRANYGDCQDVTGQRFRDYVNSGKSIEPNLRTSVLCNGFAKATESEYTTILNEVMNSKDAALRREMISNVLGCVQNTKLLKKYLETSIQTGGSVNYRDEERLYVIPGVVDKGPTQLSAAIDFLIDNHVKYSQLPSYTIGVNPLLAAVRSIASVVVTKEQELHFEELLTKATGYSNIQGSDLDAARATVKTNLDWGNQYGEDLIGWLKGFKNGAAHILGSTAALVVAVFVSLRSLF